MRLEDKTVGLTAKDLDEVIRRAYFYSTVTTG